MSEPTPLIDRVETHLLRLIEEQGRSLRQMIADRDSQTRTIADSLDIRLRGMNEVREQLNEWRQNAVDRNEYNLLLDRTVKIENTFITRAEYALLLSRVNGLENARGSYSGGYTVLLLVAVVLGWVAQLVVGLWHTVK